ncbi:unnamed protein product [Penicillium salamii]|uniref:Uncharacterized protein n=1 Tax=Penicillium salamii TaxID=1612424 RepID=A0A9W4ID36_9EURO|nr:unnamed protein product [Penicillium salamii]
MSPIDSSSMNSDKRDPLPLVNSGSLEGFIKYMGILASSAESQFASNVLDEIAQQREKNFSQEKELTNLRREILDIKETKRTTIEDMFAANENERAKQRDAATQIESLRATVNEKESMIAKYCRDSGALQQKIAKLESTVSQEGAKVSQFVKDISTLQASLKEKDKMLDQMKTAGSKLKSMLLSEQKKNEDLEAASASMNTELRTAKANLQRLKEVPVPSSEIDEKYISTKFTGLWTTAISELSPLLEQDIPEVILKEKSIWEKLKKPENILLPPSFPLIASNSSASRAVRFALILAVLFKEIDQRIYKPSYFLSGSSSLREALDHLTEANSDKEAFCRRILLSINPRAEKMAVKAEIQAVVQRISSYAGGLFSEAQQDLFCAKDDEWDHFPSAGHNTTQVAQEYHGLYTLNVFLCISLVEDGGRDPLTKIVQLRSSQELYLAAQHEATQLGASITRRQLTRPRRQSAAGSNGKPFLGGDSTKI